MPYNHPEHSSAQLRYSHRRVNWSEFEQTTLLLLVKTIPKPFQSGFYTPIQGSHVAYVTVTPSKLEMFRYYLLDQDIPHIDLCEVEIFNEDVITTNISFVGDISGLIRDINHYTAS